MDISMVIHGKSVDMDMDNGWEISYKRQAWLFLFNIMVQLYIGSKI